MTDDTGTDSNAEDPRIDALSRAARAFPVPPLDAAAFVRAARARRRRNRTIVSSVLAAAVIVAGVSVATAGGSPSQSRNVNAADQSDAPETQAQDLTAVLDQLSADEQTLTVGTARWDASERTVTYRPRSGVFDSACEPVIKASQASTSLVTLVFEVVPNRDVDCPSELLTAVATITGLTEAPTELTVTENGKTRTIQVLRATTDDHPFDALDMTLVMAAPLPDGSIPSRLRVENNTEDTVTDPGCRLGALTHPTGVASQSDPDGPLRNPGPVFKVYCGGPTDLKPGYAEILSGPTYSTADLEPGRYLAIVDYGDLRTGRVTASFEVPYQGNIEVPALTVSVELASPVADYVIPLLQGSPYWIPDTRALLYMPTQIYDSCLVDGTATTNIGKSVTLSLGPREQEEPCGDVAVRAVITISGLTEAPAELTVVEGGDTRTVRVVEAQ